MAANTPPFSLRDQCDQLVQRFDEVSNERDTAITSNKKLKNDNAGCWHIIANKQLEINTLHAEITTLHGRNRQLQQDLDTESQTITAMIGIGTKRATPQDTSAQHGTPTLAETKHPQIIINDLSVSTSKGRPHEHVTTSEDIIAQPQSDVQVIESDYSEATQPAPTKKKRKKWTRRDVVETSTTKRPRREPKPIAQTEAVVDQGTNVGISKFSVNHEGEIVNEDGEALPQDIQAEFIRKMDELSIKDTCPRNNWRFAKRKGRCVKSQLFGKAPLWTVEGPRQYACKLCANSNAFCVLWNEDVSKYLVLPLPPQFAGEGLLQFIADSDKVLSRTSEGRKMWAKI